MSSMYKVLAEYEELMQQVADAEGDLSPELAEALEINEKDLRVKTENYCKAIRMKRGNVGAIKAEIERLEALQKSVEKVIDTLEEVTVKAIMTYPDKIDTTPSGKIYRLDLPTFKLSTRRSEAVEITNPLILPAKYSRYELRKMNHEEYLKIKAALGAETNVELVKKIEASKTAISVDIAKGEKVLGAEKVTNYGLTIK